MAEKISNGSVSVPAGEVSSTSAPVLPAGGSSAPAAAPVDIARQAKALGGVVGAHGTRVNPLFNKPTSSASERGLPGGSIPSALGRAEEFGPVADMAAHQVALRHPEIFPELAAPRRG